MSWTKLRQLIDNYFNDEDLRTLCFDLDVEYESLGGEGKEGKVRELISWSRRSGRFPELISALELLRDNVDWREIEASIVAGRDDKERDAPAGIEAEHEASTSVTSSRDTRFPKRLATEFFYTLDDEAAQSFPSMVEDAVRIRVLGRTAVNLIGNYQKIFTQLGNAGCEIQFLFVDPASDVADLLYGDNPELYKTNITLAAQYVRQLKQAIGFRLQVKVIKHAPTVSLVIIEKREMQQGFMQVQLYFLHSAVGRDRPTFRVNYDDKWYGIFREEFGQLWSNSSEWNVSNYLETLDEKGEN